jgi:hypothetical protein
MGAGVFDQPQCVGGQQIDDSAMDVFDIEWPLAAEPKSRIEGTIQSVPSAFDVDFLATSACDVSDVTVYLTLCLADRAQPGH